MNLTDEQKQQLKSGQAVAVEEPSVGNVVLILADVYEAITDAIQKDELATLSKKAAADWAKDNPY